MDLVDIDEKFDPEMLPHSGHGVGMKGNYSYPDLHKQDAKAFLTEFYSRPNQELYRLLNEVEAGPYTPFEAPGISSFHTNRSQKNSMYQDGRTIVGSGTITNSFAANISVLGLVFYSLFMTVIVVLITWYLVSSGHIRVRSK